MKTHSIHVHPQDFKRHQEGQESLFQLVVGCEVHMQVQTQTKAFCSCLNSWGGIPNSRVCPVCLGLPGALPSLNQDFVRKALLLGAALGCRAQQVVQMDRKHYFYPDLPKGYQISQFFFPLLKGGKVSFEQNRAEGVKEVRIHQIHMEEDAGKNLHVSSSKSYVDFNRSGVALLEVVSEPDLFSAQEAVEYVQALREIAQTLGVCDGNMERGSLRIDVNINVEITEKGKKFRTPIVEIKNVNSFRSMVGAIEYEYQRQKKEFLETRKTLEEIGKVTRRWDAKRELTEVMREKEEKVNYRFMRDIDLPLVLLPEGFFEELKRTLPVLPQEARLDLRNRGLSEFEAQTLLSSPFLWSFFQAGRAQAHSIQKWAQFLLGEVSGAAASQGLSFEKFPLEALELVQLVNFFSEGKISSAMLKEGLREMLKTQKSASEIVQQRGLTQVEDEESLEKLAREVLEESPLEYSNYRAGKTNLFQFFMGAMMKKSQGKIHPLKAQDVLKRVLNE